MRRDRRARPTRPRGTTAVAAGLVAREPVAYAICWVAWTTFYCAPLLSGLALKAVLDRIDGPAGPLWSMLAVLTALELGRWAVLAGASVQWNGCWTFWQSLPRLNLLRSLTADPGPVAGRLPGSPGDAVSRFRDDTRNLALVVDVWMDVTGAAVGAAGALVLMARLDGWATVVVAVPVFLAVGLCQVFAHRLRRWRRREREAAAAVAGFVGDTFAGVQAVKTAAAEPAVVARLERLGLERAVAARADQVGTQVLQSLSGLTGNLGTGLVLLLILPRVAEGSLGAGDVALFTSAVTVLAALPRWAASLGTNHRQADVSVERLAELLPEPDRARLVAPAGLQLRHGPGPLPPRPVSAPAGRRGSDRLEVLEVEGLRVRQGGRVVLDDVGLRLERGTLTVVTGTVGAGKSSLLRALLGLLEAEGTLRWNGVEVAERASFLVPPRVAYVPQVPRLFSERLDETVLLGLDGTNLDEAVRRARLDRDVAAMPEGLATRVGPRGTRLSGGQVLRVATARALVRRPELLVVDDLSSALDVDTEAELWDGLLAGRDGRGDDDGERPTLLVVSHRPHVLARADQVVHLASGRRVR